MKTLHYFHDPLCGWCYGAAPLIEAASRVEGLKLNLLAGGLWPNRISPPATMRDQIRTWDQRIGQMTGQRFGENYLHGWLDDPTTVLDSRPPTAAWLAVQSIAADKSLAMLQAIQKAHYVDGLRVVEQQVLRELAASLDVDAATFDAALANVDVSAHIASTQHAMSNLKVSGFPTVFLERGSGLQGVAIQSFFGNPAAFAKILSA